MCIVYRMREITPKTNIEIAMAKDSNFHSELWILMVLGVVSLDQESLGGK